MMKKHRKYRLATKFLILSILILGGFDSIALVGFRFISQKLIQTQFFEKPDGRMHLRAREIYRQFEHYDIRTEKGRLEADRYLSSAGILLDTMVWITDSDGNIYPVGFEPEARFLDAEPVPGFPDRFKTKNHVQPNTLFSLFQPPFPGDEQFYRIPFAENDGRIRYVHLARKKRDFDPGARIYYLDHLPAMLAGYVGILSGLPLMLIILYLLVMRPISRLQQSAGKIAAGELSHRNTISGNDEIADLSQSFNHMAGQIEKMIQSTREVSGRLSHELRSPMSRLNLKKDLLLLELKKIDSNGKARRLAEDMSKEIQQMNVLIDQMLDFARLDAAIVGAPKRAVDFKDILTDIIEAHTVDIQHKKIDMTTQMTSKDVSILSSEQDLISLIQNLLSNAIKFTPEKGEIDIRLTHGKQGAVFRIANTCNPMGETSLKKIFEPFYRNGENSQPGNGLGLAIVEKIVQNLGGSISATAWEGKGICFEVRLPSSKV